MMSHDSYLTPIGFYQCKLKILTLCQINYLCSCFLMKLYSLSHILKYGKYGGGKGRSLERHQMMLRWHQNTTAGICTMPRSNEFLHCSWHMGKGWGWNRMCEEERCWKEGEEMLSVRFIPFKILLKNRLLLKF